MKILFTTDWHLRLSKPVSRTDVDYFATIKAKIDNVIEIAETVDVVILGGDLFDRPEPPDQLKIEAIKLFNKFRPPVYTLVGNHDIKGYSESTLNKTSLGVLFEAGIIKKLDRLTFENVEIYGLHAYEDNVFSVPESDKVKILVAHKLISPVAIPCSDCIDVTEVAKKTNADIVLSGDLHTPFHMKMFGRHMLNPGSLSRMSIADKDRYPGVAIIDIDSRGNIEIEMEGISSKPGNVVFDTEAYSQKMASQAHRGEFVDTFVEAVISVKANALDINDVLMDFLEKNGVADELQVSVKKYYARAEGEVLEEIPE